MGDKFAKDMAVSKLSSSYNAVCDFIVSDGESNISGKANVVKSDITTLTFIQPESYSSISIKGDNAGNEDIFSFELSGIPAAVPKSVTKDITLMFSLFSDVIPAKIDTLDKEHFRISEKSNSIGNELIEVFFTENDMNYTISYDKHSGIPYSLDAGNDELSVNIIISEFKQTTNT